MFMATILKNCRLLCLDCKCANRLIDSHLDISFLPLNSLDTAVCSVIAVSLLAVVGSGPFQFLLHISPTIFKNENETRIDISVFLNPLPSWSKMIKKKTLKFKISV